MKWSDIPGWFDFEPLYLDAVAEFHHGTFVEVGCYLGRSLCRLADLVSKSGQPVRVVGIDTGRGTGVENGSDNHEHAAHVGGGTFIGALHRNIIGCGLADIVDLIVSSSRNAARFFPDNSVQFVCLDASHDYESVLDDLQTWYPKIAPGGVIGGDDYGIPGQHNVWPSVEKAVRHFFGAAPELVPHDAWRWRKPL